MGVAITVWAKSHHYPEIQILSCWGFTHQSTTQTQINFRMSDEEFCEEESVSNTSKKGDGNFRKARGEAKKGELDEQLKEYINEWRKQRAKEEEELKRMKDKQAKRKEIRAEQEKKLAMQKREEEERARKEEAEKKAKEAEEKKKRLEEAERKRQEMMAAQKEKGGRCAGDCLIECRRCTR